MLVFDIIYDLIKLAYVIFLIFFPRELPKLPPWNPFFRLKNTEHVLQRMKGMQEFLEMWVTLRNQNYRIAQQAFLGTYFSIPLKAAKSTGGAVVLLHAIV